MNKISDKRINELLEQKKKTLLNTIDKNGLLAIFVVGKANYGFAEDEKDLKYLAFYLPTFEELCCKIPASRTIDNVVVKDVRMVYISAATSREHFLEVLFTPYYYMNPQYEDIFKEYFLKNKESISRCNPFARIEQARDRAKMAFHQDDYFETARLYLAAKCYINDYPIDYCFHMTEPRHIDKLNRAEEIILNSSWRAIEDDFSDMLAAARKRPVVDPTVVKQGVIAFMGERLRDRIDYDNFAESLTEMEYKALLAIRDRTSNNVAHISISKIVEETGISRPVYKNLLNKLEKAGIAKITVQGVKGTTIDFI